MSERVAWPSKKGMYKEINGFQVYLGYTWDLSHGRGWFCRVISKKFKLTDGFHKTNKFSAVRSALAAQVMMSSVPPQP